MTKTKIEGFDYAYNPVFGCLRNCFYCYARGISKRFAFEYANNDAWSDPEKATEYSLICEHKRREEKYKNFTPQLVGRNLYTDFPTKPSKIFVNSMSDIEYWEDEWFELVFKRIKENPEHEYYFLTKKAGLYWEKRKYFAPQKDNVLLGYTVTKNKDAINIFNEYADWISFEPLLENIKLPRSGYFINLKYVVIGEMTGSYKYKNPCKQEWIDNIVNECKKYNIKYLVKNNTYCKICGNSGFVVVKKEIDGVVCDFTARCEACKNGKRRNPNIKLISEVMEVE